MRHMFGAVNVGTPWLDEQLQEAPGRRGCRDVPHEHHPSSRESHVRKPDKIELLRLSRRVEHLVDEVKVYHKDGQMH